MTGVTGWGGQAYGDALNPQLTPGSGKPPFRTGLATTAVVAGTVSWASLASSTALAFFIFFVWIPLFVAFAVVGMKDANRGQRYMSGSTPTIIIVLLFGAYLLGGYALGYYGQRKHLLPQALINRVLRQGDPKKAQQQLTEMQAFLDSTNTAAAIDAAVQHRTGQPPGSVIGWSMDGHEWLVTAPPETAVLVLGPPRSGKTVASLIPSVLIAPGPVVSTSIKGDVMLPTWRSRAAKGQVWHFDPGADEQTPDGIRKARWSPLVGVRSWDDALLIGNAMANPFKTGNRDATGKQDPHFLGRATDWVQVLLYAAHLDHRDIDTVADWSAEADQDSNQDEINRILQTAINNGDAGARIAQRKYLGLLATPDRERGSIISTMTALLRVYDSVSAREVGHNPNFDPREFVRSNDTLYITARPDKQEIYAPLLAALLEQIRFATYDRHKAEQLGTIPRHPHVTFVLDEANNTAPIPIPAIVSEAGGQSLHLIVALQSIGPAMERWGDAAAKSFLTLFPIKVIYPGNFDDHTVHALSEAAGEYDRQMVSYSESVTAVPVGQYSLPVRRLNPTYSIQRQRRLTTGDITSIPGGHILVWQRADFALIRTLAYYEAPVWNLVLTQAHNQPIKTRPELPNEAQKIDLTDAEIKTQADQQ